MKKIVSIIIIISIVSCKEKIIEIPKNETAVNRVKEAAVPYIAKELEELDNNILIARDTTKNLIYRNIAITNIHHYGVEYLNNVTTDNIFAAGFQELLENQKKLIVDNCRQAELNKQYTQFVIEQFKK